MPKYIQKMYSAEFMAEVVKTYLTGLSIQKTAAAHNINYSSTRLILLYSKAELRNDKRNFTPEESGDMGRRYLSGDSLGKIALAYKVCRRTIMNELNKAGVKRRPAKECNWQRWEEPGYKERHAARMTGENSFKWKGGVTQISNKIRCSTEYSLWRMDVFHRDKFTCQICGSKNGGGKSIVFEAHHCKTYMSVILEKHQIKTLEQARSCEELWDVNNGQCLCKSCHVELHRVEKGRPE